MSVITRGINDEAAYTKWYKMRITQHQAECFVSFTYLYKHYYFYFCHHNRRKATELTLATIRYIHNLIMAQSQCQNNVATTTLLLFLLL